MQRFAPTSATRCAMRYEVYRNKNSSDEDFKLINAMYKRIMSEDKYLCVQTQKNLNNGVFVNGEMHAQMEKGPLYFQKMVRDLLVEHHGREEKAQHEIWPARQRLPQNASVTQKDMDFCTDLTTKSLANMDACGTEVRQFDGCCGGGACGQMGNDTLIQS